MEQKYIGLKLEDNIALLEKVANKLFKQSWLESNTVLTFVKLKMSYVQSKFKVHKRTLRYKEVH